MKRFIGIVLIQLLISVALVDNAYAGTSGDPKQVADSIAARQKKDSLLSVTDANIESTMRFLKSNIKYVSDMNDGMLLLMLNDQFKLGESKLLPALEKEKKVYMRLYGRYFNNNKDYLFAKGDDWELDEFNQAAEVEVSKDFSDALNNKYFRNLMVSFCDQFPLHVSYLNYLLERSAQSESSLLDMYAYVTNYNKNKCSDIKGVSLENQAKMAIQLKKMIQKKEGSINNKVKALALLQYGGDADIAYMMENISTVLNGREVAGFWQTDLNNSGDPDGSTTIYGLWAFCEFRELLRISLK